MIENTSLFPLIFSPPILPIRFAGIDLTCPVVFDRLNPMKPTIIFVTFLIVSAIAFKAALTYASAVTCQPAYGVTDNCPALDKVAINVQVKNPKTGQFVENVSSSDTSYAANDQVEYQLSLKNTDKNAYKTVVVREFFPKNISFVSGSGMYDKNTNILSFVIRELKPGETQVHRTVAKANGKIAGTGTGANCTASTTTNRVLVSVDNKVTQDTASLCVTQSTQSQPRSSSTPGQTNETKGGLKIFPVANAQQTPRTGPEVLALGVLIPSALLGSLLLKKANK